MYAQVKRTRTIIFFAVSISLMMFASYGLKAQRLAVSTNTLEYLVLSPNIEVEFALTHHHTLSLNGSIAPWNVSKKYSVSHMSVSPEWKYWLKLPFYGHYFGANLKYSVYDIFWNSNKIEGNIFSVGPTYGYSFIIGKKWNLVPNFGIGAGVDFRAGAPRIVPIVTKFGLNIQMVVR